jgi:4-amino-4-deoxy-L-arabinose transferase-like glycosyltransferase
MIGKLWKAEGIRGLKDIELPKKCHTVIRDNYLLFLILFLGIILRIYAVDFGLPYRYHPDEITVIGHALRFGEGDLNPHFFNYPSFHLYLLFFCYGLYYVIGQIFGIFTNPTDFQELYYSDPTSFYLIGRLLTVVFSVTTIVIVYYIGKILCNKRLGLVAACFLTVTPLHVSCSHFATVDVPVTFWITLTVLFSIYILKKGDFKYYLLAGVSSGLAISTKYNGALLMIVVFIVHILRNAPDTNNKHFVEIFKKLLNSNIVMYVLLLVLVFLTTTPYALLDFNTFIRDFTSETLHMKSGHLGFENESNGWLYHITVNLLPNMGIYGYFSIFSVFYAIIKHKKEYVPLLSWVLVYFLIIGSWSTLFARYLMPLLPFLAIFSGILLFEMIRYITHRSSIQKLKHNHQVITICLVIIIAFTPLMSCISWDQKMSLKDTRTIGKEWIDSNLLKGSKIAMEGYTPQISENKYKILKDSSLGKHNFTWYKNQNVTYFVLSSNVYNPYYSAKNKYPDYVKNYESIKSNCTIIKEIIPTKNPGPKLIILEIKS